MGRDSYNKKKKIIQLILYFKLRRQQYHFKYNVLMLNLLQSLVCFSDSFTFVFLSIVIKTIKKYK